MFPLTFFGTIFLPAHVCGGFHGAWLNKCTKHKELIFPGDHGVVVLVWGDERACYCLLVCQFRVDTENWTAGTSLGIMSTLYLLFFCAVYPHNRPEMIAPFMTEPCVLAPPVAVDPEVSSEQCVLTPLIIRMNVYRGSSLIKMRMASKIDIDHLSNFCSDSESIRLVSAGLI